MRLLGYPASKITILTTYNGQKALLRDVFSQRCDSRTYVSNSGPCVVVWLMLRTQFGCAWHLASFRFALLLRRTFFGLPAAISTVDKYQGSQNDFVLLSLVRTKAVGHVRDIRRLVVAMSRARLGLYVFCRKSLFSNCFELARTFALLNARPDKLQLVPGEAFPSTRAAADAVTEPYQVDGLVHMAQIVAHMQKQGQQATGAAGGATGTDGTAQADDNDGGLSEDDAVEN